MNLKNKNILLVGLAKTGVSTIKLLNKLEANIIVNDIKDEEKLKDILEETYGVIVYQEQVMQIAQVLGGYSLGAADMLRRAMGKKDKKEMEHNRNIFLYGDESRNIPGVEKLG